MKIINFTQHAATKEQLDSGVFEPIPMDVRQRILNFDSLPSLETLRNRRDEVIALLDEVSQAHPEADAVMIGGAPFFMSFMEVAVISAGLKPVYAFSRRVSIEQTQPDGSVVKTAKFQHAGFVVVAV